MCDLQVRLTSLGNTPKKIIPMRLVALLTTLTFVSAHLVFELPTNNASTSSTVPSTNNTVANVTAIESPVIADVPQDNTVSQIIVPGDDTPTLNGRIDLDIDLFFATGKRVYRPAKRE
jgi:hypothetical protein